MHVDEKVDKNKTTIKKWLIKEEKKNDEKNSEHLVQAREMCDANSSIDIKCQCQAPFTYSYFEWYAGLVWWLNDPNKTLFAISITQSV